MLLSLRRKYKNMSANNKFLTVILMMVAGAVLRIIPHAPNFTPTESITIFGAAYLGRKYLALVLPLIIIYCSDFIINNTIARSFFTEQEGIVWYDQYMIYNVIAIILMVLLSSQFLKKITFSSVLLTTVGASVIFFLVTNFGSWASEKSIYTNDFSGLMNSYLAGWPFFKTSLLSNLVFSVILFGSYELIKGFVPRKATA